MSYDIKGFLAEPFGWSWGKWLALFAVCVAVVASFGTKAKQPGDQSFLFVVIGLQAATLSGIIRLAIAVFSFDSPGGLPGKLVAIAALGVVLFGLAICSVLAQHGWGGG